MTDRAIEAAFLWATQFSSFPFPDAEDVRKSFLESLERQGFVVVPVEPTPRMCDMGEGFNIRCGCPDCDHDAWACIAEGYRAMLQAAKEKGDG